MTFAEKLERISKDLQSIVTRMNADGSFEIASAAQRAVIAVAAIDTTGWLDDLEWGWKPGRDDVKRIG